LAQLLALSHVISLSEIFSKVTARRHWNAEPIGDSPEALFLFVPFPYRESNQGRNCSTLSDEDHPLAHPNPLLTRRDTRRIQFRIEFLLPNRSLRSGSSMAVSAHRELFWFPFLHPSEAKATLTPHFPEHLSLFEGISVLFLASVSRMTFIPAISRPLCLRLLDPNLYHSTPGR